MDGHPDAAIGGDRTRSHQVSELTSETVLAIAHRLDAASTFADQVYRESEIDALWTLVDIEVRQAEIAGDGAGLERWGDLRRRLWIAHDLVPEGHCAQAAAVLRDLASCL